MDEYVSGAQVEWGKQKYSKENRCHSQPSLLKVDWIGLLQNNRGLRTWREKKMFNSGVVHIIGTHGTYQETLLSPQLIQTHYPIL